MQSNRIYEQGIYFFPKVEADPFSWVPSGVHTFPPHSESGVRIGDWSRFNLFRIRFPISDSVEFWKGDLGRVCAFWRPAGPAGEMRRSRSIEGMQETLSCNASIAFRLHAFAFPSFACHVLSPLSLESRIILWSRDTRSCVPSPFSPAIFHDISSRARNERSVLLDNLRQHLLLDFVFHFFLVKTRWVG